MSAPAARPDAPALSGFLNIDKPPEMTSFDVVRVLRRAARIRRVGHAGTLDRPATGVLPVALGPSTRLIDSLVDARKRYRATVTLGVTTDTYDAAGEVQASCDASGVTCADVEDALEAFRGKLQQTPPAFSAVKLDGERAWRAARRGEQPKLEPRPVTVYQLTLTACEPPALEIEVECSKGFYMRSLAHELGEALGVGGHLGSLSRTAVGPFRLDDAVTLDDAVLQARGGTGRGAGARPGRGAARLAGGNPRQALDRAGAAGPRRASAAHRRAAPGALGREGARLRRARQARRAAGVRADPRRLAPLPCLRRLSPRHPDDCARPLAGLRRGCGGAIGYEAQEGGDPGVIRRVRATDREQRALGDELAALRPQRGRPRLGDLGGQHAPAEAERDHLAQHRRVVALQRHARPQPAQRQAFVNQQARAASLRVERPLALLRRFLGARGA